MHNLLLITGIFFPPLTVITDWSDVIMILHRVCAMYVRSFWPGLVCWRAMWKSSKTSTHVCRHVTEKSSCTVTELGTRGYAWKLKSLETVGFLLLNANSNQRLIQLPNVEIWWLPNRALSKTIVLWSPIRQMTHKKTENHNLTMLTCLAPTLLILFCLIQQIFSVQATIHNLIQQSVPAH